jgi:membrane-associated phospholipid phosphatase
VVALAASTLLFAVVVEQVITAGLLTEADHPVWRWVTDHRASLVTDVFRGVTTLGNGWVVIPLVAAGGILLFVAHRRVLAVLVVAAPIITSWLTDGAKGLVGRSRPPVHARLVSVSDAAFPSGHASSSIACYATLAAVVWLISPPGWRRIAAVGGGTLLVLAIGFSRLYLGVHWLSDVVGGWLLGSTVVLTIAAASRALVTRRPEVAPADGGTPVGAAQQPSTPTRGL